MTPPAPRCTCPVEERIRGEWRRASCPVHCPVPPSPPPPAPERVTLYDNSNAPMWYSAAGPGADARYHGAPVGEYVRVDRYGDATMPDPASATEAPEVTQIDKLCGDLIAYGFGAGMSWPQSSDQLANYEKARKTRAELLEVVAALIRRREEQATAAGVAEGIERAAVEADYTHPDVAERIRALGRDQEGKTP